MTKARIITTVAALGILLTSISSPAFAHEFSEWQDTRTIVIEGRENYIFFDTDAIEYDMLFVPEEKKIHFDIYKRDETDKGHFVIIIPHTLLGGNITILVDGKNVNFRESQFFNYADTLENSTTESQLWFNYSSNARSIDIIGTCVMPEFGSECTPTGEKKITDPMIEEQETVRFSVEPEHDNSEAQTIPSIDVLTPEEQEKLWERWQMQDKTVTDIVKDMHLQYDRNDTIQAIVSFAEPVSLPAFEELLSDYELKLQLFNFGLTNNSGSLGTNKMHDFSNLTKIIEEKEEYFGEKLTGITRIVANGSAKNYQELLIASNNAGNNMTISEFHILRKIDDNMLQGEELKQRLERATEILSELNETMREQIPWTIVSKSSGQNWYLSVAIDDRVATEPRAVYADRLKKLVGEDIPIVVSFGHVELT
jgi:hypothetical protein